MLNLHRTGLDRAGLLHRAGVAALAAFAVIAVASPAKAESAADFYRGKTVSILMGTGPGASYDLYGRTIAEHIGRHIPGSPTIIASNSLTVKLSSRDAGAPTDT